MELVPEDQIPQRLHDIADHLATLNWYCEISPARYAWPYATLWGDDSTGARLFIRAGWGNKPMRTGRKRFPSGKYGWWFSPASSGEHRSPWCSMKREARLMQLAADPLTPIGPSVWRHGYLPREQTGCNCDKLRLYGEEQAAEALARAQAAREAGMGWRQERRYYQCPQDALAFHLTSRESWEPRST